MPYVVERIVAQGRARNKDRVFIPTSFQSKELIVNAQLLLGDVDQYPVIDVTIDGADEVDETLNCIKGGGACHLREKVLAEAADTFILVADYRKNSDVLGKNVRAFCRVSSIWFSCPVPAPLPSTLPLWCNKRVAGMLSPSFLASTLAVSTVRTVLAMKEGSHRWG